MMATKERSRLGLKDLLGSMTIGILTEMKPSESRVGMTPAIAFELTPTNIPGAVP